MAHNGERFSASVAGDRTATSQHFSSLTGLFMVSSLLAVLLLPAVFGRSRDPLRQSAPETTKRLKGSGNAQDVYELELGKSIKRELAGGQQHTYELKLGADQFAQAIVEQEGIDVTVQVLGPDGKQMLEFDSEARLQGVEEVPLVAEAAGDYQLIVQSKSKGAPPGGYEIRIEELRAATERDRTLQEARRLYEEAVKERGEGKLDEALTLTEHTLGIRKKLLGPDHRDVAATITYLGLLYSDEGEYAKAEPLYQQALNIFERELGPEHPNVAMVLNNLAILYRSRGEYTKAEPAIQRALAIREKALGPEHILVAQSLNSLAILYFSNSEYVKAEPLYQRALAIWEKALGPEHPDVAKPLSNLAVLYGERGEYAKAEPFYRRALAIREKALGPEHPDVAQSLNNLAAFYCKRGEYASAEPLYQRALAIFEKAFGPEHLSVAYPLINLASLYYYKGDYTKAEPLNQRVLAIQKKALGPEHPDFAESLNNLANLYYDQGEYAKAESLYQQVLAIFEKALGPEHPKVAVSLNDLGTLYRHQGEYDEAETLHRRALAISEKALGPEHPAVAESLNNLAYVYQDRGEYAKAEPLSRRALEIQEKALGPRHPDVAVSLSHLAAIYAAEGDLFQAVAFQSRANAISEYNLALNLATGSERQKLAYLALSSKQTDFTLSLHSRYIPDNPQALDLAFTTLLRRKGRGLDAMMDNIGALRRHSTPEDQKYFDQLAEARSQLAALTLRESIVAKPDAYMTRLKSLEEKVENLEADLSARSAEFRVQSQSVTISAVQAALPNDSALIEFTLFTPQDLKTGKDQPPRYLAYVLPAQGPPKWADLGEAEQIDRSIDEWRKSLRGRPDVKELGRELDEKVMRPLRALLQSGLGETRRLLIAPDGSLNLIPFAALVDEHDHYLVESYTISYLTSGRDLLRLQKSEPSRNPPLVVANPVFGRVTTFTNENSRARTQGNDSTQISFRPLPGTQEEALAIKAVMPGATVLLGNKATKSALKHAKSPVLLHIATHGFFLGKEEGVEPPGAPGDDPLRISNLRLSKWSAQIKDPLMRSGLALAGANQSEGGGEDGVLTALEAAGLDLWGTKLVVLSACDTGVGEVKNGEGVQGLRRALVLAGSESQVMSLWPVSDLATKDLMVQYYQALKRGEGRSEGLRQVQLRMLHGRKDRQHPFYWAAFIQSGEWANLDGRE